MDLFRLSTNITRKIKNLGDKVSGIFKEKDNERKLSSSHITASCITIINFILLCCVLYYMIHININHDENISHVTIKNMKQLPPKNNPFTKWCPKANCHQKLNCKPCQTRFLFILAQACTGSTTLQNMINLLPGVRIRDGFYISYPHQFFEVAERLTDVELLKETSDMHGPFSHYAYPKSHLLCTAQKFIYELTPKLGGNDGNFDSSEIIGFKEVNLNHHVLGFLLKNFPCSRYIFNIRSNEKELIKSLLNYTNENTNYQKLPIWYKKVLKILGGKRVYLMDVDEWSKGTGEYFTELARWMGFRNCTFDGVRHDYRGGFDFDGSVTDLGPNCRLEE